VQPIEGPAGEQGDAGERGDSGQRGVQGERGPKGDHGQEGHQGEQGEQGKRGDSGQRGQGERGDRGDRGVQGDRGQQGDHGQHGETGAQGEQGERGLDAPPPITRRLATILALLLMAAFMAGAWVTERDSCLRSVSNQDVFFQAFEIFDLEKKGLDRPRPLDCGGLFPDK